MSVCINHLTVLEKELNYLECYDIPQKDIACEKCDPYQRRYCIKRSKGEITDKSCGSFVSFMGCIDTEKHKISDLERNNYDSMVDIHLKHKSCYSYNCPICYLSWAVRAAHAINDKLESLGGKYGVADHIVVSIEEGTFKSTDNYEKFLPKIVKAVKKRGVIAGYLIFHGFRYADQAEAQEKNVAFGWRWSPHFHILGFIRNKKQFYKLTEELYQKDKIMVHLQDKRKTVFGTAWYQLNHASVKYRMKHFEVARKFGEIDSDDTKKLRELSKQITEIKKSLIGDNVAKMVALMTEKTLLEEKIKKGETIKEHHATCRICGQRLKPLEYHGSHNYRKNLQECKKTDKIFYAPLQENGIIVWLEKLTVKNKYQDY